MNKHQRQAHALSAELTACKNKLMALTQRAKNMISEDVSLLNAKGCVDFAKRNRRNRNRSSRTPNSGGRTQ